MTNCGIVTSGKITTQSQTTKCSIGILKDRHWYTLASRSNQDDFSRVHKGEGTVDDIDRYNGNIESTPEGKEFFRIIDNEKTKLGINSFCNTHSLL